MPALSKTWLWEGPAYPRGRRALPGQLEGGVGKDCVPRAYPDSRPGIMITREGGQVCAAAPRPIPNNCPLATCSCCLGGVSCDSLRCEVCCVIPRVVFVTLKNGLEDENECISVTKSRMFVDYVE